MKKTQKYRLFENGIDSIAHGIEHFLIGEKDNKNFKFAILHIFHGIEMILKEKLFKINPILIYSNIDQKINESSHTIGFSNLVIRLENVGIKFSKEEIETINGIQRIRNQIEHKDMLFGIDDVKFKIGKSIKFLINFMRDELNIDLQNYINKDNYKILVTMIDFYDEQVKIVEKEIEEYLKTFDPKDRQSIDIFFCPYCNNRTVIIEPDEKGFVTCHFCKEDFTLNIAMYVGYLY
ncbi:unnamed protein product [marine sediment metagenome]|uniref:Uncharacterized protein n=1 Tax=marine sediment metagenome TaxID=412755 RepID=X1TSP9_9ZZZZ